MFQAWQLLWKICTLKYQERGGNYSSGVGWVMIYLWKIYNVVMKNKSSSHRLYSLHLLHYGTFPRFTSTWDKKNQTSLSQNYNKQQVKWRYKCRRALQMPSKSIQVSSQSGKTKLKVTAWTNHSGRNETIRTQHKDMKPLPSTEKCVQGSHHWL